ncbi:Pol polyprotein [Melia azedarach]|uniref:Pol polyprotein n=1 Tax=Melia azedarach TaxID=155640 RepID=A0ACC1X4H9_MELAZ|nr:Pol polyprotein [Melia azedarach]
MSSYKIVFEKVCHLPVELEHKVYWVVKALTIDMKASSEKRLLQLNEMEEFHNDAFKDAQIQKEKTKKWHNNRILRREFKEEEQVLLFTSRLKLFPRKIRSRWSGPFLVNKDFLFGAVELQGNDERLL